jgi:hypothetical protein
MLEDKNGELRGRPFPDPETAAKAETPDSTGKEEEIEDDTDDGEETPPRLF